MSSSEPNQMQPSGYQHPGQYPGTYSVPVQSATPKDGIATLVFVLGIFAMIVAIAEKILFAYLIYSGASPLSDAYFYHSVLAFITSVVILTTFLVVLVRLRNPQVNARHTYLWAGIFTFIALVIAFFGTNVIPAIYSAL